MQFCDGLRHAMVLTQCVGLHGLAVCVPGHSFTQPVVVSATRGDWVECGASVHTDTDSAVNVVHLTQICDHWC